MIHEDCTWRCTNNVLHCNWYETNRFYSSPALAAVHRWPKWDVLPHVIHGIITEPLSAYQGTQRTL